MAEIEPFRGYRYDASVTGDVGKLIAPPYDVIDDTLRERLFRVSDWNIARITRAHREEEHPSGNPYQPAGELWEEWRRRGVVRRDAEPAVYVYEQFFDVHGHTFSRTGVIALVRLRTLGEGVLPHEDTLTGPRQDRLELMRATRAQFGPVFGLYPDPEGRMDGILEAVKRERPLINVADSDRQFHRIWALTDGGRIGEIQAAMQDREILIADGHHRYETTLAYRQEHPECEAAKYRMMALVNMSSTGLVILPIHRLVKGVRDFSPELLLQGLRKDFEIRTYPGDSAVVRNAVVDAMRAHQARGRHTFGMYLGDGNHHIMLLRDDVSITHANSHSETWSRLDVMILHRLILDQHLGITPERVRRESNIEYVQDFPYAIMDAAERVRSGGCQALFLLNATRVGEVQSVAQNRERMPQKSTFFYPKVYAGLVFYGLE